MAEPQLGLPQLQLMDGGLPKTLPHQHLLLLPRKVCEALTLRLVMVIQKKLWILPPAWNTQGLAGHFSSSCHMSQATALTFPTGAHFKCLARRLCEHSAHLEQNAAFKSQAQLLRASFTAVTSWDRLHQAPEGEIQSLEPPTA